MSVDPTHFPPPPTAKPDANPTANDNLRAPSRDEFRAIEHGFLPPARSDSFWRAASIARTAPKPGV